MKLRSRVKAIATFLMVALVLVLPASPLIVGEILRGAPAKSIAVGPLEMWFIPDFWETDHEMLLEALWLNAGPVFLEWWDWGPWDDHRTLAVVLLLRGVRSERVLDTSFSFHPPGALWDFGFYSAVAIPTGSAR